MNDSNRKRIILNSIGPFIAMPCLGEVSINRNYVFGFSWLLAPASLLLAMEIRRFSVDIETMMVLFVLFYAMFAAYLIVSITPFIRDGYRRLRDAKQKTAKTETLVGNADDH